MEWQDKALILGVRPHGESSGILETMTREHGRHLGIVRLGKTAQSRSQYLPGNLATVTWRARLEEHLGQFTVEVEESRASTIMQSRSASYGLQVLAAHLRLLAERDPHTALYDVAQILIENLHDIEIAGFLFIKFEVELLNELGFGLSLDACALGGDENDLYYVSPTTGRAASREAGQPWKEKLLRLPSFLVEADPGSQQGFEASGTAKNDEGTDPSEELSSAFKLTSHFFSRNIYGPRGINPPMEREALFRYLIKQLENTDP